jgi:hypothetical protein
MDHLPSLHTSFKWISFTSMIEMQSSVVWSSGTKTTIFSTIFDLIYTYMCVCVCVSCQIILSRSRQTTPTGSVGAHYALWAYGCWMWCIKIGAAPHELPSLHSERGLIGWIYEKQNKVKLDVAEVTKYSCMYSTTIEINDKTKGGRLMVISFALNSFLLLFFVDFCDFWIFDRVLNLSRR